MKKEKSWLEALSKQGLTVYSARDACAVQGWLDTGNYALNYAISGQFLQGYPLGHMVEIFGDPSTGKSYLITRAISSVQTAGGVALLDDTERAYNNDWMENLGVDVATLAYTNSRTVKDHLAVAQAFVKAYPAAKEQGPALLACDSLAALSTEHELEVQLDKKDMTKAGELKAFFRIVAGDLHRLPIVHLSTNHKIANIGNPFQKSTTSGGGGPKYGSSVRIDLRSISKIKAKDTKEYVGVICTAFIDKNRLAPPWKKVRLAIPFYNPISRASGLIPVLIDLGILEKVGDFIRYKGRKLKLRAFISKDKVLRQDEEAESLLDIIPEILEEADAYLIEHTGQASSPNMEEEDDNDEEGKE